MSSAMTLYAVRSRLATAQPQGQLVFGERCLEQTAQTGRPQRDGRVPLDGQVHAAGQRSLDGRDGAFQLADGRGGGAVGLSAGRRQDVADERAEHDRVAGTVRPHGPGRHRHQFDVGEKPGRKTQTCSETRG